MNHSQKTALNVAFPTRWGQLTPGQQHTLAGSIILNHEFESLIKFDDQGVLRCNLAKGWQQSEDFKTITFEIDTSRKFSDGSGLTSYQIKAGWLDALGEDVKATNHSMKDVFYKLIGFEDFAEVKDIKGIETPNESTLVLKFKEPFRTAIDHLNGVRFAASKKIDGRYIGTGPYIMTSWDDSEVRFKRNPLFKHDSPRFEEIYVRFLSSDEIYNEINGGTIDLAFGPALSSNTVSLCSKFENIGCWIGSEALHFVLQLNGLPGRFFADRKMRSIFQNAVFHLLRHDQEIISLLPVGFKFDDQIFLKTQAGRIQTPYPDVGSPEDLVDLVEYTRKNPIKISGNETARWFWMILDKLELHYVDIALGKKGFDGGKAMYKDFLADVDLFGFSIIYGDPDGIYHALGKNGAIATKMILREKVSELLEEGRQIVNQSEIDGHYQKVTKAVWEEVPFVHVGFSRRLYLYNNKSVKPREGLTYRMGRDFSGFEPL